MSATTVHVKNISSSTSEKEVRDFFSFCGKISSLSLTKEGTSQTAAVSFEKATAAKTALLLDNTQLGQNVVQVSTTSTLEELSSDKAGAGESGDDLSQEDKPRSRIVAEYLAAGYVIGDKAIEQAIALDGQHGVSQRFTSLLQQFDAKYHATEKTKELDEKYQVSQRANAGWFNLSSYFEKALDTPTGQKLRSFYEQGNKQVLDVHNEARRLADLKGGAKATPEQVPGTNTTKCQCYADNGKCGCEAGKCACSDCPKNASSGSGKPDAEKLNLHKVSEGKTACDCGGEGGICACEAGQCACASCPKN